MITVIARKNVSLGRPDHIRYSVKGKNITVKTLEQMEKFNLEYGKSIGYFDTVKIKERWKDKIA